MNQQALATVILRILGLSYGYSSLAAFFGGNLTMQVMNLNEVYGDEKVGVLSVMFSVAMASSNIMMIVALLLMLRSKTIIRILTRIEK